MMLPKDVFQEYFYFYSIIMKGYLNRLVLLSIDKEPSTHDENNFWMHSTTLRR